MAHKNVLYLVLLEKLIIDVQDRPTRIAKYVVDLFFLETPYYNLRTRQLHVSRHFCVLYKPSTFAGKPETLTIRTGLVKAEC
ncbi:MAG TPA: hypothetical protein VGK09_07485 [Rhodocyclaceae bacterium]